jgi:hypothetical protein
LREERLNSYRLVGMDAERDLHTDILGQIPRLVGML